MTDETAVVDEIEEELEVPEQTGDEVVNADQQPEPEEPEEITVSIGEESPPPEEETRAPEWVRDLRKQHRELQKRNRELEQKLQASQPQDQAVQVGKKPTLEEYDYDTSKFEMALENWYDRKRKADDQQARLKQAEEQQQQEWQNRLNQYSEAKTKLKVKDYDDAENIAQESLNVVQQGVILQGAENPALLIYALGKNPKKARELGAITDPVKFAFAVAKMETQLKVQAKKAPPAPEKTIKGTGPVSGAVDATLERLRAEAERTGDMSKVVAYKRSKRNTK